MNTKMTDKISTRVWQFLVVILFGSTISFVQANPIRSNGKIAFVSDRDGNLEIYVMNSDGTGQLRLTNNTNIDYDYLPAFSPDGRKIAFVSQNGSSTANIKVMNADGTNQTVVTSLIPSLHISNWFSYRAVSWSPDGRKIAFDDGDEIFTVDIDGGNRTNLTNHPATDVAPAWSPDGTRILFVSSRDASMYLTMHTMNAADGGDVRRLPSSEFSDDEVPDWSPAVNKVTFTRIPEDFHSIVYTADADGKNRQIFDGTGLGGGGDRNKPKWSPDGTQIVFSHWKFPQMDAEIYVKNTSGGAAIQLTDTFGSNSQPTWQPLVGSSPIGDFDGDGRSDVSAFRPSDRTWRLDRSTAGLSITQFGLSTDKITPADFDGDGKTDIAVYRDGTWWRLNSSNSTITASEFGLPTDVPVPADYTGDGSAELAIYRGGTWWILDLLTGQSSVVQFGTVGDRPIVGDFDGDGRADQAVYRDGEWHLNRSSQGYAVVQFGVTSDTPVVGDYDGDAKTDPAVFRDGTWYVLRSRDGMNAFQWGLGTDVPTPADYDGDGRTDAAIFRGGVWWINQSTNGIAIKQFGLANDKPIPAAYLQ